MRVRFVVLGILILVFVILVPVGAALAQTNGSDCTLCHGATTDFTTAVSTTKCSTCHDDYNYLWTEHYLGTRPSAEYWDNASWNGYGTFQQGDPLSKTPLEMHNFHRDTREGCTWCHAYSGAWNNRQPCYTDCDLCHVTVEHRNHGSVEPVEISVINNIDHVGGNWLYKKSYTCLNASCHGMPTAYKMPSCTNCHTVDKTGHGDITAKHLATEVTPNCIDAGCHYSNYITTEHEGQGYPPCDVCHNYTGTKLDPVVVRGAIDGNNPECSACHLDKGDHYPAHEADPAIDSGLYGMDSCQECHLNNLQDEHARRKDQSGNYLDCDSCHAQDPNSDVGIAISQGNTNCDACHTVHGNVIAIHESPTTQWGTDCYSCHASNLGTLHYLCGLGCSDCHEYTGTKLDPQKVYDAIEVNNDTTCQACHTLVDHPPQNGATGDETPDVSGPSVTWDSQTDFETNETTTGDPTTRTNLEVTPLGDVRLRLVETDTGTGADGELVVDGTVGSNSTDGQVHNASNPYVMNGSRNYTNLTIQNGGVVTHNVEAGAGTVTEGIELKVTGTLYIDETSRIDVTGKGYDPRLHTSYSACSSNAGPGAGWNDFGGGAGGAGYGGKGGNGSRTYAGGIAGSTYGTPAGVEYMGSGGGNTTTTSGVAGYGGAGGGRVKIVANTVNIEGSIQANGIGGSPDSHNHQNGAGGGSGGGIYLAASTVNASGYLSAAGGGGGAANLSGQTGFNGVGGNGADVTYAGELFPGGLGGLPGIGGDGGNGGSYYQVAGEGGPSAGGGGGGVAFGTGPSGGGGGGAGRIATFYNTYNGGLVNSGVLGYAPSEIGGTVGPYAFYGMVNIARYTPGTIGGENGKSDVGLRFDVGSGNKATWKSLDWDAEPVHSAVDTRFQVRVGNTLQQLKNGTYFGYDGTSSTWFDASHKTIPSSALFSRYIEIKVRLTTGATNTPITPVLHSVSLRYEPVETGTKDCTNCHAQYPEDSFNRASERQSSQFSKCSWCHIYHYQAKNYYKTDFGWFRDAEGFNLSNPETLEAMHTGGIGGHGGSEGEGGFRCGTSCHKYAPACTDCHESVAHDNHGNVVGQTETYPIITPEGWGEKFTYQATLSCTNANCHGLPRTGTFVARPSCTNCHLDVSGIGGHYEVHETEPSIDSGLYGTDFCQQCHLNNLQDEHPRRKDSSGNYLTCDSCHGESAPANVKNAISSGKTNCDACHTIHGNVIAIHESPITQWGTDCDSCHASNLGTLHDLYGLACSSCHEYAGTKLDPQKVYDAIEVSNDTTCDACHLPVDHVAQHDTIDVPSLECLDCHKVNVADEHVNDYNLTCDTCHDSTNPAIIAAIEAGMSGTVVSCPDCHETTDHIGQHDMVEGDDDTCDDCHEVNVAIEHDALLCTDCHNSTDQAVSDAIAKGSGPLGETVLCLECHGVTDHRAKHESPNTDCTSCHEKNIQDTHNDNCDLCHSEAATQKAKDAIADENTDCYACHSEHPHAESCRLCHSDKNWSDYVGRGVDMHDKHMGKVNCGVCHPIPQTIDIGSQNGACGNLCHSAKSFSSGRSMHSKHITKIGANYSNACYWCHGLSVPQRPADICVLCHSDESGGADVAHDKHGKLFDCTVCHGSVAGFGPDVRTDPSRQVCSYCHSPKSGDAQRIHRKHWDKAQCYACHGDSDVYASYRGDKDCSICHEVESGSYDSIHKKHAGKAMMCAVCHSIVPPNVEGIEEGIELSEPPGPELMNQPPVADAGADKTVTAGQGVVFSGSSSYDLDGTIVSYQWNFGDSSTAIGMTVNHIYSSPGIYTATLTVTDDKGAVGVDTATVTVNPAEVNLALNKSAAASGDEGSSYSAAKAVDGDMSTRWWAKSDHDEWIKVDLGSRYSISKVVLKWHSYYAKEYEIQVSTDGEKWQRVYGTENGNGGTDEITFSARDARYVMVKCKKDRDNSYSLYELEVYE